ncbi:MAG: sugar-binding transcriptional regulator [Anaerolineae bacterium]|nr:sugar-binding transcriptional regulator [Anaerolineae bacterium]
MIADLEFKKLLYKVAKAYYEDDLTQQQIGQRLGLSRIKVSRLLSRAREDKIVQIAVVAPQSSNADLEREIEARYGLHEAIVVASTRLAPTLRSGGEIGAAAAECLARGLQGDEVLTLSWGTTLLSVVDALPAQSWPEIKVVQMLGGLGLPEADVYGADLVHRTALALGAKPHMLSAPGIVASALVRDALLADPQIAGTLTLAAQADLALVGLGRPTPESVLMRSGILSQDELDKLHALGAVGDIALRFFDARGKPVEHEINERIIGLDLEQMRRIPRVIGVAGGPDKYEVIRAALRGKLIDVLVTDEETGRRLMEEA